MLPEPSLHDWEREAWERRERKRDAMECALQERVQEWTRFHYLDKEKPKAKGEIAELMASAMSDLYGNDKDSTAFDHALFCWYAASNREAEGIIMALIHKYVVGSIKRWKK